MKQIEFERWEPDAENPRRLTYAGQRTAEDVFHELEAQLDSVGYLPDEYFNGLALGTWSADSKRC